MAGRPPLGLPARSHFEFNQVSGSGRRGKVAPSWTSAHSALTLQSRSESFLTASRIRSEAPFSHEGSSGCVGPWHLGQGQDLSVVSPPPIVATTSSQLGHQSLGAKKRPCSPMSNRRSSSPSNAVTLRPCPPAPISRGSRAKSCHQRISYVIPRAWSFGRNPSRLNRVPIHFGVIDSGVSRQ
jgi:hypothetical protein